MVLQEMLRVAGQSVLKAVAAAALAALLKGLVEGLRAGVQKARAETQVA